MELVIEKKYGITEVIIKSKRFDYSVMKEIKEAFEKLADEGNKKIILNLENVEFMDSSGLSVIISLYKRLNQEDGKLVICGLQEQPTELINITQLYKLFNIVENCKDVSI